ncbi:MAG: glycosyltransferase [Bacteroidales bacterium]|jgi:glycosyltransferase involved in cell wall biosynthesis
MQKICIVVPCYNESKRLPIKEFNDFINNSEDIYFCFVNDGSKDNTIEILSAIKKAVGEKAKILDLKKNQGKAEAVRKGILESLNWMNFEAIGYFDADLSTPLSEILTLYDNLNKKTNYKIAFCSRIKIASNHIERSSFRHYSGRVFSTFVSIFLGMSIYDTQCGAKLIRTDIINEIFKSPFYSKWFFDIEIFYRIKKSFGGEEAIKNIIEVPINQWIEKGKSKISLLDWLKVPFILLKLYFKYM